MITCPFTKAIWEEALKLAGGNGKWQGYTVVDCLDIWFKTKSVQANKALPCIVLWALWLARNDMIFKKKEMCAHSSFFLKSSMLMRECGNQVRKSLQEWFLVQIFKKHMPRDTLMGQVKRIMGWGDY